MDTEPHKILPLFELLWGRDWGQDTLNGEDFCVVCSNPEQIHATVKRNRVQSSLTYILARNPETLSENHHFISNVIGEGKISIITDSGEVFGRISVDWMGLRWYLYLPTDRRVIRLSLGLTARKISCREKGQGNLFLAKSNGNIFRRHNLDGGNSHRVVENRLPNTSVGNVILFSLITLFFYVCSINTCDG